MDGGMVAGSLSLQGSQNSPLKSKEKCEGAPERRRVCLMMTVSGTEVELQAVKLT